MLGVGSSAFNSRSSTNAYHDRVLVDGLLELPHVRLHGVHVHGDVADLDPQQVAGLVEANVPALLKRQNSEN